MRDYWKIKLDFIACNSLDSSPKDVQYKETDWHSMKIFDINYIFHLLSSSVIVNVELICWRAGDVHAKAVPALTAANETVMKETKKFSKKIEFYLLFLRRRKKDFATKFNSNISKKVSYQFVSITRTRKYGKCFDIWSESFILMIFFTLISFERSFLTFIEIVTLYLCGQNQIWVSERMEALVTERLNWISGLPAVAARNCITRVVSIDPSGMGSYSIGFVGDEPSLLILNYSEFLRCFCWCESIFKYLLDEEEVKK